MSERRQFSRIHFPFQASLCVDEQQFAVELLDLSLKGALITRPKTWVENDKKNTLCFSLTDEIAIEMEVLIRHCSSDHLGLECTHIDIDSISHLRRLMELNTASDALLQRELDQLIAPTAPLN